MKNTFKFLTAVAIGATVSTAAIAGTLDSVKSKGILSCGVNTGLPGFSQPDSKNHWAGLDVDACRTVAAAVLGNADKVKYIPLTAKERFTALQSGEIDMLSRNTTLTHSRDTSMGLNGTVITYYDGQGFLVGKKLGVKSALELNGAAVCIQSGTTTELNLADYFRANKMSYKSIVSDTTEQSINGFEAGRCDVLTADRSALYALRVKLAHPDNAVVLPEVISKEPLGPMVRQGDDAWFNVVKWSLHAWIAAEEMGITSANVDKMKKSTDANIARLLGTKDKTGANMGVSADWGYQIIKQVGNYGESFERNLGDSSALKIGRGINALWTNGGLQYAPPIK